ncbi:hypothetical protein CXF95_29085 [Paraglaciecola sp. MB-3u-78]|jgi:transposase|nr:hypothetical protein CXF95_29085 [Paraglaciecola sp. MB-3u-78]
MLPTRAIATQQIIDVPSKELSVENSEQYEIIDHKDTCRLAQQLRSYTLLFYLRPVQRHKSQQSKDTGKARVTLEPGYGRQKHRKYNLLAAA